MDEDIKNGLAYIHGNKEYPRTKNKETEDSLKKAKKAIVKAFQIGKHALVEWGIIIEDYDKYDVNYNINHNIMVKNQKEIVRMVDCFIQEKVKDDGEFAQFAFNKKNQIFPLLLLICSRVCLKKGINEFKLLLNNGNTIDNIKDIMEIDGIEELYSTDGVSIETEKRVDKILSEKINL